MMKFFKIAFIIFFLLFGTGSATLKFSSLSANENISIKLEEAMEMADQVLEGMGLDLPNIVILPNVYDAYASEGVIYVGEQMIAARDQMTLSQILLHEAGHIFEGHTGQINDVMEQMVESGVLSNEQRNEILRNDELMADMYAAIGSWIMEPGALISSFSQYLQLRNEPPSDTHPSSDDRIEFVENIIDMLSLAETSATFESSGLEALKSLHTDQATVLTGEGSDQIDHDTGRAEDGTDGHDGPNNGDGSDGDSGGDGGGDGGG